MAVSRVVGPPEKRFSLEPVERRCAAGRARSFCAACAPGEGGGAVWFGYHLNFLTVLKVVMLRAEG